MANIDLIANKAQNVVATVDKDSFRSFFYLLAGKPDSKQQVFDRHVLISPSDVQELNTRIRAKLKLNSVDDPVSSISVQLSENQSLSFGTWAEFTSHDWKIGQFVRSISIKWDFLLDSDKYSVPQRHTLSVTITRGLNPAALLRQMLNSADSDVEVDPTQAMAGCIARVDFIYHILADELLSLVGKWHETLSESLSSKGVFRWCERNDRHIATAVTTSLRFVYAGCFLWYVEKFLAGFDQSAAISVSLVKHLTLIVVGGFLSLGVVTQVTKQLGQWTFDSITNYGKFHPFRFTVGDTRRAEEIANNDKKMVWLFLSHLLSAILLHVIAGLIIFWITGKSH